MRPRFTNTDNQRKDSCISSDIRVHKKPGYSIINADEYVSYVARIMKKAIGPIFVKGNQELCPDFDYASMFV